MQRLEAKDARKHIAWKYSTLLAAHRDRTSGRSHCEAIHVKVVNLLDWGHQRNTWPYSSTHWGGNWIDSTLQRCNFTDKRLVTLTLTNRYWLGMEVCFKQGPLSSYTCLRVSITRMLHCTTQHWQVDDEHICLCTWKESGFVSNLCLFRTLELWAISLDCDLQNILYEHCVLAICLYIG